MDSIDRRFLRCRSPQPGHEQLLSSLRPSQAAYLGVSGVFSHQPAAYGPAPSSQELADQSQNDHTGARARHFYHHCYIEPTLRRGFHGGLISVDDFERTVVLQPIEMRRNRVCFLTGQVGVGKSAFINYLITTRGYRWVHEHNLWFVRLDVDISGAGQSLTAYDFLNALVKKACEVIHRNPVVLADTKELKTTLVELDKTTRAYGDQLPSAEQRKVFQEQRHLLERLVVRNRTETGRRLVLIIDNMDYVCHKRDRFMFLNEDTGETETLRGFCELVGLFLKDRNEIPALGCTALVVTRWDSYNTLKKTRVTSLEEHNFRDDQHAYSLEAPTVERVLETRGKLLTFVDTLPESSKQVGRAALVEKAIRAHLESRPDGQPILVEHLKNLTNHGLREMMTYFAQYSWINPEGEAVADALTRFVHQYPVGLLAFMLGRHCLFSQPESRFPNVYLVHAPNINHVHSYWLKRLILEFVRSRADGFAVHPCEIYEVFCSPPDGYEESLVRLCLGSLAEANCSNAIFVERSAAELPPGANLLEEQKDYQFRLVVDRVCLTDRGRHLLEHVVDRFYYLQLVVDEPLLPLPSVVAEEFSWGRLPIDYSYIVETGVDYHNNALRMVTEKMRRVLVFLEVLDWWLDWERRYHKSVFVRLQDEGVLIPRVSLIGDQVVRECLRVMANFQGPDPSAIVALAATWRKSINEKLAAYEEKRLAYRSTEDGGARQGG